MAWISEFYMMNCTGHRVRERSNPTSAPIPKEPGCWLSIGEQGNRYLERHRSGKHTLYKLDHADSLMAGAYASKKHRTINGIEGMVYLLDGDIPEAVKRVIAKAQNVAVGKYRNHGATGIAIFFGKHTFEVKPGRMPIKYPYPSKGAYRAPENGKYDGASWSNPNYQ